MDIIFRVTALGIKGIGLVVIALGIVLFIVYLLYKAIFKVRIARIELAALEKNGLLDEEYAVSTGNEPGKRRGSQPQKNAEPEDETTEYATGEYLTGDLPGYIREAMTGRQKASSVSKTEKGGPEGTVIGSTDEFKTSLLREIEDECKTSLLNETTEEEYKTSLLNETTEEEYNTAMLGAQEGEEFATSLL